MLGHSLFPSARQLARAGILVASLAVLLPLGACGGGGSSSADAPTETTPPGDSNPPTATAPTIVTQPAAQSVTAPAGATFSVTAGGTAPLTYQWRSSSNGTDWTDIAGATTASYATGATDVGLNGRYYSVVVGNAAGSVASSSVQLAVRAAPPNGGPTGEFPHTPNPLAVAVTRADAAVGAFGVTSTPKAAMQESGEMAVVDGVKVAVGVPGNAFLEDQTLAVTPVTLAGVDAAHPLPFQAVLGAFDLAPADSNTPEPIAGNLVRVTFTLSQAALDGLGGRAVIFSARSDGTQLHLVPVFANDDGSYSTLTLTTRVDHVGLFGLAALSDEQATALAAAWPAYADFQLQAALAPPSYGLRAATLAAQPGTQSVRARPLGRVKAADAASDATDWAAQMEARIDAFYNDVVVPSLNAANAADADITQFNEATRNMLTWERQRQLLGLQDDRDSHVSEQIIALSKRGLEKAKQNCAANGNAAAASQVLAIARTLALLGEADSTDLGWVMQTCGRSKYDVSIDFRQVHTEAADLSWDSPPWTGTWQLTSTLSGKLHMTDSSALELSAGALDYAFLYERVCKTQGTSCQYEKQTIVAQGAETGFTSSGLANVRVERWNLDARGHYASPTLYLWFQNPFGSTGSSFSGNSVATQTVYDYKGDPTTATYSAIDYVDATPWSGTAPMGTSSRIVRRSTPLTGAGFPPDATARWTTSLSIKVTEVKPNP